MNLDLVPARFLRRYKRFFADCELPDGTVVTAHCPNTGSMKTLIDAPCPAWLRHDANPKRKLEWTLTLLGVPGDGLALVDTSRPNAIVEEAVRRGRVPALRGYSEIRREVAYGRNSRIDLHLAAPDRPDCYIEVKNVTMRGAPGRADFPDAVTSRGLKHLEELSRLARRGTRAVQFFLVSRTDCRRAGIAASIDPAYAKALARAVKAGVEILCYRAAIRPDRITAGRRCALDF